MKRQISNFTILKSNRRYALGKPVEAWLNVPGNKVHIFWKDEKGCYFGMNDMTAHSLGVDPKNLVGLDDYEVVRNICAASKLDSKPEVSEQHLEWINNDKLVFNTGRSLLFYNYIIGLSKCILFLSQKSPLYDINNKIVGTFGLCFYLAERDLSTFKNDVEIKEYIANFENQSQAKDTIPNRIILKNVELSPRETSCTFYLAKGFTAKQIADKLAISPRTVEAHLNQVKGQVGCYNNCELTELLFKCGIF